MADFGDEAAAVTERDLDVALGAHRARREREQRQAAASPAPDPGEDMHCLECGEVVPPERIARNPHTRRCTPCASDIEARN